MGASFYDFPFIRGNFQTLFDSSFFKKHVVSKVDDTFFENKWYKIAHYICAIFGKIHHHSTMAVQFNKSTLKLNSAFQDIECVFYKNVRENKRFCSCVGKNGTLK